MSASRILRTVAVAIAATAFASPVLAQDPPSSEQVLVALRDVSVAYEGVQVRNALGSDVGGSALLQLSDGTLVDARLVPVEGGWSVRDLSLIAGSGESFRTWSEPWRERVAAAQNFLAGVDDAGLDRRTAEELAPLTWFEDPEQSSRLWGMNPVTYRLMQTMQMMPTLTGPTGVGPATNPIGRRQDQ